MDVDDPVRVHEILIELRAAELEAQARWLAGAAVLLAVLVFVEAVAGLVWAWTG